MKISKNLISRALTGIIFVSVILIGILYSQYSFAVIVCLIQVLALTEFYKIIEKATPIKVSLPLNILGGVLLFAATFISHSGIFDSTIVYLPYICYFIILFISELYRKQKDPIQSLAYSVLGQIYIVLPFSLLNNIVYTDGTGIYHYKYLLAILILIWVNDSFAYLSGVTLGKHRMFERISPKKSWEGFIGGAVFAVIASVIIAKFFPDFPTPAWVGFAIVVVVFGTFGDLIESLMKRTLNIKDSGNLLPGHGGVLDRFDSLILAIPAIVVYLGIVTFFIGK